MAFFNLDGWDKLPIKPSQRFRFPFFGFPYASFFLWCTTLWSFRMTEFNTESLTACFDATTNLRTEMRHSCIPVAALFEVAGGKVHPLLFPNLAAVSYRRWLRHLQTRHRNGSKSGNVYYGRRNPIRTITFQEPDS